MTYNFARFQMSIFSYFFVIFFVASIESATLKVNNNNNNNDHNNDINNAIRNNYINDRKEYAKYKNFETDDDDIENINDDNFDDDGIFYDDTNNHKSPRSLLQWQQQRQQNNYPKQSQHMSEIVPIQSNQNNTQYMLELYQKFSDDKYSHPIADIVRSFVNLKEDPSLTSPSWHYKGTNITRNHTMIFNVSSIENYEDIKLAELRFCSLTESDVLLKRAPDRRVTLYELIVQQNNSLLLHQELITSQDISGHNSGWETYTMTETVKKWVKLDKYLKREILVEITEMQFEARLEDENSLKDNVYDIPRKNSRFDNTNLDDDIEEENTVNYIDENDKEDDEEVDDDDLNQSDDSNGLAGKLTHEHVSYEPMLVVFSNDRRNKKATKSKELKELEKHEADLINDNEELINDDDDSNDMLMDSNDDILNRVGRRNESQKLFGRQEVKIREKRQAGRGNNHKNRKLHDSCRRRKMYINFEDIHWNNWIVLPKGYQAYECVGQCHFPLNSHLTPTKYTSIKSLLHATYPKKVKPTCCVPTKLEPISILYYDDNNVLTYKFKYEEMVVAQCGCR